MRVNSSDFRLAVNESLGRLCADLGFDPMRVESCSRGEICRFQRGALVFLIAYCPSQCDLDVRVELSAEGSQPPLESFDLGEIAVVLLGRTAIRSGCMVSTGDPARFAAGIEILAEAAREVLPILVRGGEDVLRRVRLGVRAQRDEDALRQRNADLRRQAESAWSRRDLREVVRLYERIAAGLSPLEQGRLAYARKHS